MTYRSLPEMHRRASERLGDRPSLRFKQHGLYHNLSWSDYRRQADWAAAGLIDLGVDKGDRVVVFSPNRYEWLIADHAILSTGAVNVPLHAPLSASQAAYQVGHSESKGIILSGAEQAEKLYSVLDSLPMIEFVVSFEPIVPRRGPRALTWQGLKHRGRQSGHALFDIVRQREKSLTSDDLATIIYTSGTTGNPKGVMLTHGNLASNTEATLMASQVADDDVLLSWLPYSHIYARTVDHYVSTMAGMTLCLAESLDTLIVNLKEIVPTWVTAVPRFYEKVWASVENLTLDERKEKLRDLFGPRIKQLSSGGAPLPRHVCQGLIDAGMPILEGYGLTESSPVISFNNRENYRVGSVGKAIPEVEVKIADDGEILTRGPHVMKGYWKNPEATAETIVDGWLRTGDIGRLDQDGFLFITDRKKDLIITSGGKNIAPGELERLLVSDPYIDQAIVYGDAKNFVTALIVPNSENLATKASHEGWRIGTRDDFITSQTVLEFFQARVDSLMQSVSSYERVKKFLLLARPFQMAADELTATLKVRRRHIISKYQSALDALYAGSEPCSE